MLRNLGDVEALGQFAWRRMPKELLGIEDVSMVKTEARDYLIWKEQLVHLITRAGASELRYINGAR